MPCLNEAETLGTCISKALLWARAKNFPVEILVSDNGSTDGSIEIARSLGARVLNVDIKGYGSALDSGIKAAKYNYVIMADADDSYDFTNLDNFANNLDSGADLVVGNRFTGGIEKGAMPWKNKYIGNPILSMLGRKLFKIKLRDFHCGIRAVNKQSYLELEIRSLGMEYATEMIVKFAKANLNIVEVPTTLRKDGRSRPPHLRPFRDGWRHLKLMLLMNPKTVFMVPGAFILILSLLLFGTLSFQSIHLGSISLDRISFLFSLTGVAVGLQLYLLGKIFQLHFEAIKTGETLYKIPVDHILEKGLIISFLLTFGGLILGIQTFKDWAQVNFGELSTTHFTQAGWSILLILLGMEFLFTALVAHYLAD